MKRLLATACSIAVLAFAAACGTEESKSVTIESLFPGDGALSGWAPALITMHSGETKNGPLVGRTKAEIEALINGDARSFFTQGGFVAFAWNWYQKDTAKMDVRVWQMKDAATATTMYDYLPQNDALYSATTFEAHTLGDASRIANTGTSRWLNVRKGAYIIEAKGPIAADVEAAATAILGKL